MIKSKQLSYVFYSIWKMMSLNESMNSRDRAKLAVWDYPGNHCRA